MKKRGLSDVTLHHPIRSNILWYHSTDIGLSILKYLDIKNFMSWRICSRDMNKSAVKYWKHPSDGMAQRIWEHVKRVYPCSVSNMLRELVHDTGGALSGSFVLRVLTQDSWSSQDIDVFLPFTPSTQDKFIQELVKLKQDFQVIFTSYYSHLTTGEAWIRRCPPLLDKKEIHLEEKETEDQNEYSSSLHKKMVKNGLRDGSFCDRFTKYNKHNRSLYIPVRLRKINNFEGTPRFWERQDGDINIDIVFVMPEDMGPSIYTWISNYFDLDVCANTVTLHRISCLSPHGLATHRAILRPEQFCFDIQLSPVFLEQNTRAQVKDFDVTLKPNGHFTHTKTFHEYGCNCEKILIKRLCKYHDRGFTIQVAPNRLIGTEVSLFKKKVTRELNKKTF